MSSQQPRPSAAAASGGRPAVQSAEEQRLRRRRRKQTRLLAGVVGFWVAMGVAIYAVDWRSGDGEESPFAVGDWENIRHAPLDDRTGAGTAWAGDRLVLWGGYDADSADGAEAALFTDGATWTGSGEWRDMAAPPRDLALSVGGFAEWTGSEVIFGPVIPAGSPAGPAAEAAEAPCLLAYDPADDSWREVPVTLGADPDENREADGSAESGTGTDSDELRLVAHRTPQPGYTAALVGEQQLLLSHDGTGEGLLADDDRAGALLIDTASGDARLLPYDGSPYQYAEEHEGTLPVRLAATGSHAVALLESGPHAWSLDLADPDARWEMSDAPEAEPLNDGPDDAAADRAAADGADGDEPVDEEPQPSAAGGPSFAELLGASGEVLALRGDAAVGYDPESDQWRSLSEPPPAVSPETGYVWTGSAALSAGLVYHPDADTWARTPELPLHDEDSVLNPHAFWTGDVFAVFGGLRLTGCPEVTDCDISTGADTLDGWVYLTRD